MSLLVGLVLTKSLGWCFNYVADNKNIPTIISCLVGVGTIIAGAGYTSAEANQRTSYVTGAFEVNENGTYSPDPDTRSRPQSYEEGVFIYLIVVSPKLGI